LNYKIEARLI